MPTIFSHAIFASAIGKSFRSEPLPARFWILTVICSMLPDADVVAFIFGIRYDSMLGHRGITHSIAFAMTVGAAGVLLLSRTVAVSKWKLFFYFSIITLTHPLLDMLTDGGLGVALFAPFSDDRFFFPWRPIEVSPIGMGFFTSRGLAVVMSEIVWVWVPSLLIASAVWLVRKRVNPRRGNVSRQ